MVKYHMPLIMKKKLNYTSFNLNHANMERNSIVFQFDIDYDSDHRQIENEFGRK